jgi:hypothetical protein
MPHGAGTTSAQRHKKESRDLMAVGEEETEALKEISESLEHLASDSGWLE